jgi:ABC-type amino acid transport substrate-binding protein
MSAWLVAGPVAAAALRVGLMDVAPYGYAGHDGQPDGAYVRLAREIVTEAGFEPSLAIYPTARLYAMLQARQLDLTLSSRNLDRDLGWVQLGRVGQFEGWILTRRGTPMPSSFEALKGKLIGRMGGTCPPLARAGLSLYTVRDYPQGLRMLAVGRIDALCGERAGLEMAERREAALRHAFNPPWVFLTADVRVYANPGLQLAVIDRLRRAVQAAVARGSPARHLHAASRSGVLPGRSVLLEAE